MAPKKRGDVDIFFTARGQTHLRNDAKRVCFSCPVRPECLEFKKATGSKSGIWGGE